ncbi:hypothetical protein [uncultured Tenacibaculum sp.]|uniref:hypothetical protein n=1 Tax=uncultured Tenacibaculum sp. TaxID=174713 RepID=UPI002633A908|nr:hypothetical protein [uncultured Tenacibaculum sp.]
MLQIAERFVGKIGKESDIETVLSEELGGKTYGNVYHFESKEYILTGDSGKALAGNGFFMVEKENGRVVIFGTALHLEDYLKAYENGTFEPSLKGYWYPDEDRFDYK